MLSISKWCHFQLWFRFPRMDEWNAALALSFSWMSEPLEKFNWWLEPWDQGVFASSFYNSGKLLCSNVNMWKCTEVPSYEQTARLHAIRSMLEMKFKTSHQNVTTCVLPWRHSVTHKCCTDPIPVETMQPSRPATHWLSPQPVYCQQKLVEMFCYPGCNTMSRAIEGQSPWWGLPSQCGLRGGLSKTEEVL